ncbi:phosphonate metabolism transcriptional regulator PhnF [soil metagenome]
MIAPAVPASTASTSKHALVAASLTDAILRGEYGVGSTLPSEPELTVRYGVSRHTVRSALRSLQDLGLVTSQQGVGSIVRAQRPAARYTQAFGSIDDLIQYTQTTRMQMIRRETVEADAAVAEWIGCKPGERWLRLYMLRISRETGQPVTAVDLFVPYAFGAVLGDVETTDSAIFKLIEQRIGEPIVGVKQEIAAVVPTFDEAAALQIGAGQAVLAIVRRYFGRSGQVLEATRTLHGADFRYSMDLRLARGHNP